MNITPEELAEIKRRNPDLAKVNPPGVHEYAKLLGLPSVEVTAVSDSVVTFPKNKYHVAKKEDRTYNGKVYHSKKEAQQSERSFQEQVIQLARLKGWKVCHFRPARVMIKGVETWRTPVEGDKGCPDTILAKGGVVLLWELKTEKGRVTAAEKEWLDASGGKVMRPSDWETICLILQIGG